MPSRNTIVCSPAPPAGGRSVLDPLRITLVSACVLAMAFRATPSSAQCLGDFNGDVAVTVDELVVAVRNSLDSCAFVGPRFVDNHDGTVTDRKTGLVWEQKDGLDGNANPADPHDADNLYTWSASGSVPDGTLFTAFLAALDGGTSADGVSTSGCFADHCDWRVATIEELSGIVDRQQSGCDTADAPCVDPAMGPTQPDGYWSGSAFSDHPTQAWLIDFSSGNPAHGDKDIAFFARTVRGSFHPLELPEFTPTTR